MEKRGQFYLIAAILIVVVVFGVMAARIYVGEKPADTIVVKSGQEIRTESGNVIVFAIFNDSDAAKVFENWTDMYVNSQSGSDINEWIFVYGNSTDIVVLNYSREGSGSVNLVYSGGTSGTKQDIVSKKVKRNTGGKETVTATIDGMGYEFELQSGTSFGFLIMKEGTVVRSDSGT